MQNINNKGSEWNIWDLHVHTPESIVNHYKGSTKEEKWQSFLKDIENLDPKVKVIGINDYIFLDGYKKILDYKLQGRLKNIDCFLPVIEFRIKKFAGHKEFKRINFHVIFSDEIKPEIIEAQFLNGLQAKYTLVAGNGGITWSAIVTKDSLADLGAKIKASVPSERLKDYGTDTIEGFNNLNIDEQDILKLLEIDYFKGKTLTAIGKTEWASIPWGDGSIAEKKDCINSVNLVFTSTNSIEDFEKSKVKLKDEGIEKLLLDCSDAHYNVHSAQCYQSIPVNVTR
jgi:hypothetical protein